MQIALPLTAALGHSTQKHLLVPNHRPTTTDSQNAVLTDPRPKSPAPPCMGGLCRDALEGGGGTPPPPSTVPSLCPPTVSLTAKCLPQWHW